MKVKLSNDAKKLLKLRYCKPGEEPEDIYPRVAKALGEHDGYEKEFLDVMASRRFLPNSPALMNAGLSNALKACFVLPIHDSMTSIFQTLKDSALVFQSGGGCFVGGTLISISDGCKPIENVNSPDHIISMEGETSIVSETFERKFKGDIYEIKTQGCLPFRVTGEHPILVLENGEHKWKNAEGLKKNDYLCIPRIKRNNHLEKLDLAKYTEYPKNLKMKSISFDEDFGWFLGLYMAEGSSNSKEHKISLAFNITERDLIERLKSYIRKMGYRVWERTRINCVEVTFSAVALARYLEDEIGKPAHLKRIPNDIFLERDETIIKSFLRGYWEGDGSSSKSTISFKTASPHIASQIQLLAASMGIFMGIAKGERKTHEILGKEIKTLRPFYQIYATSFAAMAAIGKKKPTKENISRFFFDNNFCYVRIRRIEKYPFDGKVFNLSTEKTHTYLVHNIVVHNCGYNFSELRQAGSSLSRGGSSSGVMPFLNLFNSLTEAVKSGGRRRGASMAILNADHPQILDFIKAKLTPGALSNFNLSILVDNQFMDRVTTDEHIYLRDRKDKRRTLGKYKARDLFNIMTFAAYLTGDPGLMFYDRINQDNPFKEKIKASNPCVSKDTQVWTSRGYKEAENIQVGDEIKTGEGTIGIVDAIEYHPSMLTCRVELENGDHIDATASHQFYARKQNTWMTQFLQLSQLNPGDMLIDYSQNECRIRYIMPRDYQEVYDIHEPTTDTWITNGYISRGCGEVCMFPYESCCLGSINLNEHIVDNDIDWPKFKETAEIGSQMLLSMNKYSEYPVDECYKQNYKMNRIGLGLMGFADALMKMHIKYDSDETLELIDKITGCMLGVAKKKAPTSASVLSVAPTGSLSILASCSPSIEPIFSESYTRNLTFGTIEETREKNEYLRTAHEISPMWHLKIQAQFQKTIDNAVSKCLRKGIYIPTTKGSIPIESLHQGMVKGFQDIEEPIYIFDDQLKRKRILRSYYDGEGEVISVETEDGCVLEGSVNHKIWTIVGWKTLHELKIGDYAARYHKGKMQHRKITVVKNIGIDHLFDIEVEGNHTYLVNGFITHNTVNLPYDATIQDIYDVYYNAWKMGCKGVTVFRDGSKGDQVMISKPASKCDGEACYL